MRLDDIIDRVERAKAKARPLRAVAEPLLSLPAAARYIGIGVDKMRELVARGRIPHYTPTGTHRRFRASDLDRYMESCRVEEKRPRVESPRARLVGRTDGRPQKWD